MNNNGGITDDNAYELQKQYTARCGLKVNSYTRIMREDERKKSREQTTEEIVRILQKSGKL